MTDRDLMEDILLILKGEADLQLHGTIESSTSNVHTTFNKVLNETLTMQNEVYQLMAQKVGIQQRQLNNKKLLKLNKNTLKQRDKAKINKKEIPY